jgi:hypothetical protein
VPGEWILPFLVYQTFGIPKDSPARAIVEGRCQTFI